MIVRGGIKDDFLVKMTANNHPHLPIESLELCYTPSITVAPVLGLIKSLSTVTKLTITWPIPRFNHNSLDPILSLGQFTHVSISVDYISNRFFENYSAKLTHLNLQYSGVGKRWFVEVDALIEALDGESVTLPNLKNLGLSPKLREFWFEDVHKLDTFFESRQNVTLVEIEDVASIESR